MDQHSINNICSIFLLAILAASFIAGASGPLFPAKAAAQDDNAPSLQQNSTSSEPAVDGVDDIRPPVIKITEPSFCSDQITTSGSILVKGVASDSDDRITKVEAFSHKYPFNDEFPFSMATPVSPGNWSQWSIPLQVYDTKTRILVRATNSHGIENWDEIVVDTHQTQEKLAAMNSEDPVAFVEPTFTAAAYNVDSFYSFYYKYFGTPRGQNITSDLDYMTGDIPADADISYFMPLVDAVKKFVPKYEVSIIGDTDVNDGVIFRQDGSNSYDVLFMLHNEYVTQQEYDNLKRFVSNGGTIVFLDGNIFYGEVSYDRQYCTATLVKGHDWEFDGKFVRKSVSERYFNETQEWVGSNFMINDISDPVTFSNNPFNYTHFEENYMTNSNDVILHDFGMTLGENYESDPRHVNNTIATYELQHGKGKVLVLGIYGQNKASDPLFLEFFNKVVLMHTFAPHYDLAVDDIGTTVPIYYYSSESVNVHDIVIKESSNKLVINAERGVKSQNMVSDSVILLVLPKKIIDIEAPSIDSGARILENLIITVNGEVVPFQEYDISNERIVAIPLSADVNSIEIQGSNVIPEFPVYYAAVVTSILFSIISIVSKNLFEERRSVH